MRIGSVVPAVMAMLALAGCLGRDATDAVPDAGTAPEAVADAQGPDAQGPDAQGAGGTAPAPVTDNRLGTTVASLGDPTSPGFWIRTPLVNAPTRGLIVSPKTGASVEVDLLPIPGASGAGSQLSLAAMRLLGGSLTDLPEIIVYRI